jgi:hypothetical protein
MARHPRHHPRVTMPDVELDSVVRHIMETVLRRDLPWSDVDEAIRIWFYRPPSLEVGPRLGVVRRNLQLLGLDLVVAPLALEPAEPFRAAPLFASKRAY